MNQPVTLEISEQIGILRVNRPRASNALNWEAQAAFAAAVSAAAETPHLRALIITGAGNKAFVAGGDLRELAAHPEPEAGARLYQTMGDALALLATLPFPVIGAVNGDAAGGGVEVLTACDLRLSVPHARLHVVNIRMGLTTGWGGTPRLVRLVGQSRAMDLLLNGRTLTAAEAQSIGLIHRLCNEGEGATEAAIAWAHELAALPKDALAALKSLVWHSATHSLRESYHEERALFAPLYGAADNREAIDAFLHKRPPHFNR